MCTTLEEIEYWDYCMEWNLYELDNNILEEMALEQGVYKQ